MKVLNILFFTLLLFACKKETPKIITAKLPVEISKRKVTEGKVLLIDTVAINKFKSKLLKSFYLSYNNETVWQYSDKRTSLINTIKKCEDEGLLPYDYHLNKLIKYEERFGVLSDNELVDYDLLLTNSFQKYLSHLSNGKLRPKYLYTDWALKENEIDINLILDKSLKTDSLSINLEKAKPNHIVYIKLKKALQIINAFPYDTIKNIKFEQKIVLNDTNNSMFQIKRKLIYWKDLKKLDTLTSIYDKATFDGVKTFQKRHGIISDGIIGQGTISALNIDKKQRTQQIIANLERWRWYPKDMGKLYLIINIPDYKLTLVKNNDTIEAHKVIVGSSKRKTPILTSKLSYAVFNPTWTVPPTIIKEDIIPATIKNRGYLAGKNIKVYNSSGTQISASAWQPSKATSYRYVQSPGTYNSLGMVKLIFPNNFSVYLHDTNHRDYFEKTNRSLSSGCVRVQNVLQLTEYVIDDATKWSKDSIAEVLKTGITTNVTIKKPTYVQILYWTAWSENKTLIFRTDIYNLDADLYKKLRN